MNLIKNINLYIILSSFLVALGVFIWVIITIPNFLTGQIIKLDQFYALLAIGYLYLTLLISPVTSFLPRLQINNILKKMRKSLGVSAFVFGLLHAILAFFGELGGIPGLSFLDDKYLIGIGLSSLALLILFIMTATSFNFIIVKISYYKWKFIHRFVYLAGILIIIHSLLLGLQFSNLSTFIPQMFFIAIILLLVLEMIRLDDFLQLRYEMIPRIGISLAIFIILSAIFMTIIYFPNNSQTTSPFNVHALHIQLAKQAQQTNPLGNYPVGSFPTLQGDPTRRFTASFIHPDIIKPGQDINLSFQIYDANSGNQINLFSRVYEKVMHLVIVDSQLKYFNHIHPSLTVNGFSISTQFPHEGQYHLYIDYQPLGAIEQQQAFTVNVGQVDSIESLSFVPDIDQTKVFGNYEVKVTTADTFQASLMSIGQQSIKFKIFNSSTHQPITTLKPYLASFGHLIMINEQTYDYIHVHPSNIFPPKSDSNGGPDVEFIPLGLYGPIKPGIYRVFGQFNPDNNLFTADFTIKIQ